MKSVLPQVLIPLSAPIPIQAEERGDIDGPTHFASHKMICLHRGRLSF